MTLDAWISAGGLPALAISGFLEGDSVAFLGGVLAHRGLLQFESAVLAVAGGAVLADQAAFAVGRFAQDSGPVRRVRAAQKFQSAISLLNGHPILGIFAQRFFYGGRMVFGVGIGLSQIVWPKFLMLNIMAALIWAHLVTALGYGAGHVIERLIGRLDLSHHLLLVLDLPAMLVAVGVTSHLRRPR